MYIKYLICLMFFCSLSFLQAKTTIFDIVHNMPKKTGSHVFVDKFQGCIIGASLGDALGRVTEFIPSTDKIFARYPNGVRSFDDFTAQDWLNIPSVYAQNKIVPYTDDTAMAVLVADALIDSVHNKEVPADMNAVMSDIALRFIADMYTKNQQGENIGWTAPCRAPGLTAKKYVQLLEKHQKSRFINQEWWRVSPANGQTGGCGSVMRAYPFGLLFYEDEQKAADWAAAHSYITHGDAIAVASCAAFAKAINMIINFQYCDKDIALAMIQESEKYSKQVADKLKKVSDYAVQAQQYLTNNDKQLFNQLHEKVFTEFPGWAADDALAGALYAYLTFSEKLYEEKINSIAGIYLGVHTPGDSDSIASIAGALIGARIGFKSISQSIPIQQLENKNALLDKAEKLKEYFASKIIWLPA